jgi:hypothetical protein
VLQADAYGPISTNLYSMISVPSAIAENGENVVWDISAYGMNHFATLERMPAEGTPYSDSYQDCEWAEYVQQFNGVEGYSYYSLSDTLLELMGFAPFGPNAETVYYVVPLFRLKFPFAYNDEVIGTGQIEGGVPLTSLWKYVGYGTLITSVGTYTNVVKLADLYSPGASSFWTTDPLVNVLAYGNFTFFNIELPATATALQSEVVPTSNVTLVVDGCTLTLRSEDPVQFYRIFDAMGRAVSSGGRSGGQTANIDLTNLRPGWYVLQYQTAGGSDSQRFQLGNGGCQ